MKERFAEYYTFAEKNCMEIIQSNFKDTMNNKVPRLEAAWVCMYPKLSSSLCCRENSLFRRYNQLLNVGESRLELVSTDNMPFEL